jgi:hypothetical protein
MRLRQPSLLQHYITKRSIEGNFLLLKQFFFKLLSHQEPSPNVHFAFTLIFKSNFFTAFNFL